MGQTPPKTVGSKSPTARSSIFRSPSAVRIVVPFRKQLGSDGPAQPSAWLPRCLPPPKRSTNHEKGPASAGVVLAIIADAAMAPILARLRREVWRPASEFSKGVILVSSLICLLTLTGLIS